MSANGSILYMYVYRTYFNNLFEFSNSQNCPVFVLQQWNENNKDKLYIKVQEKVTYFILKKILRTTQKKLVKSWIFPGCLNNHNKHISDLGASGQLAGSTESSFITRTFSPGHSAYTSKQTIMSGYQHSSSTLIIKQKAP